MEEQKKKKSPAGIILLILLALLIGAGVYLYYTVFKAPVALDDPKALAAAAPMRAEERFAFSADGTAQVKIDARDFWNLVYRYAGEDFLDVINQELTGYGLTVTGCGIDLQEEGLGLNLELLYKEKRLVAKVPCELSFSGKRICLTPAGVKVGIVSLPVKGLLSNVKIEYDLTLPVISQVTDLSFQKDALVLTGPVEADIRSLAPETEVLYKTAAFSDSLEYLAEVLMYEEALADQLSNLEKNPGRAEAFYRDLFLLAGAEATKAYLDGRYGLTERFFPGIDFAGLEAEQTELEAQLTVPSIALDQLFTEVVNIYNEKRFQLSEGEFLFGKNSWDKKEPFRLAEYGAERYADLFAFLDPNSFFLILVDAEDGYIRKTSSFYRMCDENQQFTREADFNKTYILGCVFRSVGGDPFLMYESELHEGSTYNRIIKLLPLTEEAVSSLQQEGKFGIWTN